MTVTGESKKLRRVVVDIAISVRIDITYTITSYHRAGQETSTSRSANRRGAGQTTLTPKKKTPRPAQDVIPK